MDGVEVKSFPIFDLDEGTDELVCPSCGHRVSLFVPGADADHWLEEHPGEKIP